MKSGKYVVYINRDTLNGVEIDGLRYETSSLRKMRKDFKAMIEDAWQIEFVICDNYTGEVLLQYDKHKQTYINNIFIKKACKILK